MSTICIAGIARKWMCVMKIEFEITDDEIREAMRDSIRIAVNNTLSHWNVRDQVEKMVKEQWPDAIRGVIDEMVSNHAKTKEIIAENIARKLRAQVSAALKLAQAE